MASCKLPLLGLAGLLVSMSVSAADPAPPATAQSPAASVGLFVYAAKGQDAAQQSKDETECYGWSKTQSGIDPAAPAPAPASAAAAETEKKGAGGERIKGAARGAAAGAVIGEVANNDASDGAAIGATAGVVAGGRQARKNRQAQEEKAAATTAANADAAKAAGQQQLDTFKRGMGACLEGRGYSVK
jgi:YMGG-like Gly-zipper